MHWISFALLSTFFWAAVNVLDSLLVKRYEKSPPLLMWSQAIFSVSILFALSLFIDIRAESIPLLVSMGCIAYVGDLTFFLILDRLDVSVTNAAWAILSILLAFSGFLFFGERWTSAQFLGSSLIIIGIFLVSFWHSHVSILRTVALLSGLAALYLPFYTVKKWALVEGVPSFSVFFWMLLGRECCALLLPLTRETSRRKIVYLVRRMDMTFFGISGAVIVCFLLAEYLSTLAFDLGPLSLVPIVSNVQPFMVMTLAWGMHRWAPHHSPRENVSGKSYTIKSVAFFLVFIGLALLAPS